MKLLCVALAMLVIASLGAHAATITVTVAGAQPTEWAIGSFSSANISAPGNDLPSPQTGSNPTITIAISGVAGTANHTVKVSRAADATWNSTYTLWIQPLSTGTGPGTLTWSIPTGTWTQIPTAPAALQLCTVKRNRTGVTLRLQLQNLTVTAGTTASNPSFLTTLTYTWQ
jgi:hypothetical protein